MKLREISNGGGIVSQTSSKLRLVLLIHNLIVVADFVQDKVPGCIGDCGRMNKEAVEGFRNEQPSVLRFCIDNRMKSVLAVEVDREKRRRHYTSTFGVVGSSTDDASLIISTVIF